MRQLVTRFDPRRAPVVALLLAPACLLVLIVGLEPEQARLGFAGDLSVYRGYGLRLLQGAIPYLDFHVEYPPLALAPMTLPLLTAPGGIDDLGYIWRFTVIQGVLAAATGWLVFLATGRSRSALVLWAVLVWAAWASVALRYDLWPVLCVLVAVLVVERRPGAAGAALGLGTVLKLYPIAVLPILGAWALTQRDRAASVRLAAGFTSVVALVMATAWALAGPASFQWLTYQEERGLQIESLGAGLVMGLHVLVGQPVEVGRGFGSIQVQSPGSDVLIAVSPFVLAGLLAIVTGVAVRRFRRDRARLGQVPRSSLVLASVAAIAMLLVSSKVLSVQYVVWFLPFIPLLPVLMRWMALAITVLSTVIYTVDYQGLMQLETPMILALLVRNALLAAFAAWLLVELWGWRLTPRGAGDGTGPQPDDGTARDLVRGQLVSGPGE